MVRGLWCCLPIGEKGVSMSRSGGGGGGALTSALSN